MAGGGEVAENFGVLGAAFEALGDGEEGGGVGLEVVGGREVVLVVLGWGLFAGCEESSAYCLEVIKHLLEIFQLAFHEGVDAETCLECTLVSRLVLSPHALRFSLLPKSPANNDNNKANSPSSSTSAPTAPVSTRGARLAWGSARRRSRGVA